MTRPYLPYQLNGVENARLKKLLAEAHLDLEALKVGFGVKRYSLALRSELARSLSAAAQRSFSSFLSWSRFMFTALG